MLKTIQIGPQVYTVRAELEAEVRRLLWSSLRGERQSVPEAPVANDAVEQRFSVVRDGSGRRGRVRGALRLVHG